MIGSRSKRTLEVKFASCKWTRAIRIPEDESVSIAVLLITIKSNAPKKKATGGSINNKKSGGKGDNKKKWQNINKDENPK